MDWKQVLLLRWWRRQREIRMLRSWYVRVGPEDMSRGRGRLVTLVLAGGPVAAVVAVPVMVLAAIGSDTSVLLLAAIATAGLVVVACALWRSAGSLTLCVALLGSVAAVLSVRGAEHPVLHWTTVAALIAALGRDPERVPSQGVPRTRRGQLGRAGAGAAACPRRRRRTMTGAAHWTVGPG